MNHLTVFHKVLRKALMVAAIFCIVGCFAGCLSGNDSAVADVAPRGWSNSATMTYDNHDTLSQRRATVFLRHDHRTRSGEYAVEFRAPSGLTVFRDTFEIDLPNTRTFRITPLPRPVISMSWEWPYRSRVQLREKGEWLFIVTPLQQTRGVWSVGVDLSKPLEPLPYPLPQDRPDNQIN